MNLGFYLFSSTMLLVVWLITVLIIDHLSFWRFRPGQITHEYLGGVVDKSYGTDNIALLKRQGDLFRHWIIGLGSGDLHMQRMGGGGLEMDMANCPVCGRQDVRDPALDREQTRCAPTSVTGSHS
ncbi:MAG TPA: hypothetical protein VKU02_05390 [Gemmataceae bacterium]|nr:hypothetical protein [Gemmataceae bacterium]